MVRLVGVSLDPLALRAGTLRVLELRDSAFQVTILLQSMQEFFNDLSRELNKLFSQGIPEANITGQALTAFLWIVGIFVLLMIMIGIVVAIARYVSETAVIRMVDEYETTGAKMSVSQGFRIGWSRTAWQLFLINLFVNLPAILLVLILLITGISIFLAAINEGLYTLITVGLINIVISMYYYLVVVKKMYINEPTDPSPLTVSPPMRVVVYAGLAGTLILGVYPQPIINWVVAATLMFSNLAGHAAASPTLVLPIGG